MRDAFDVDKYSDIEIFPHMTMQRGDGSMAFFDVWSDGDAVEQGTELTIKNRRASIVGQFVQKLKRKGTKKDETKC